MNWLKKAKQGIKALTKRSSLPDGLWEKCPSCGEILFKKELAKKLSVCPRCQHHFRISAREYISIILDDTTFIEIDRELTSSDPLHFKDTKKYTDRIKDAHKKTALSSAIITGVGFIDRRKVAVGVMDFSFLGGSMGSVVGEKIYRLIKKAVEERLPVILVTASGGARMQESILSLMQMAKTSAAVASLSRNRLPLITVLTNPTTGGVAASFAFQGDIIIAEPRALIGFAGPRVIKETVGEELPQGFQRSEFLLEHGMIDMIVSRKEMKGKLAFLIDVLTGNLREAGKEDSKENVEEKIKLVQ